MNKNKFILLVNVILLIGVFVLVLFLQHKPSEVKSISVKHEYTSKEDNQKCLKCHANLKYDCRDTVDTTKMICKEMNSSCIIDTAGYYHSNHYDFGCTNCHSSDFEKTPHDPKLKDEKVNGCLDCHAEDETMAKYHFDSIGSDFKKSVHVQSMGDGFSCYSCHNSHTNKTHFKDSLKTSEEVIAYANDMCFKCHGNDETSKTGLKDSSDLYKAHQWLPNANSHLSSVRCIECHAQSNPNMDVAHNILPKTKAIKDCNACHNPNSSALNDLYKNRKSETAKKLGFEHPEFTKKVNIIGDNHNKYLNIIGLSVLSLMIFALSIHVIFRLKNRK